MEENNFDDIAVLPRTLGFSAEVERERRALLVLCAGRHLLGVYADEARSVSEDCKLTLLPHAPPAVLGVASIRGRMHTVLDPALLLRVSELDDSQKGGVESTSQTYFVALNGEEQLALRVEEVRKVVELFSEDVLPLDHAGRVVRGVVKSENGLVVVLNQAELFAQAMQGTERRRKRT